MLYHELLNSNRARLYKSGNSCNGPVIYWMSRDQRVEDNWALIFANSYAESVKRPLIVVFTLAGSFLEATWRQYDFMLKGLEEVERGLAELKISFFLLQGEPEINLSDFISEIHPCILVTDFDPLKIKKNWKKLLCRKIEIPVYEVDAHNIVPCWMASEKEEYSAGTFRPRITGYLKEYLIDFPKLKAFKHKPYDNSNDWKAIHTNLKVDKTIIPVHWLNPGAYAAKEMLHLFIKDKIHRYFYARNDPNQDVLSNLSPYLHFGQISAQRVALEIHKNEFSKDISDAFLEQLIVRRELSDNFCHYNQNYDSIEGIKSWAYETLNNHRIDQREYIYKLSKFEHANTHDELWNAAQTELTITGKMHGYMRMYWAKKILEWTATPEEAIQITIFLNDRYSIDGRDPNGYVGCAWSIGGIHDRAWAERPVFGKIRYMNANGCRRKFNVHKYISTVNQIARSEVFSSELLLLFLL